MTLLQFRPVNEAEIDDLVALYQRCADFIRLGTDKLIDAKMVQADLDISGREGGRFEGIYTANGQLIGVLDVALDGYEGEPDLAFLILLMIDPAYRGQGLGAQVVRRVEIEVWANPRIHRFQTAVQVNNPKAAAFWEAVGFDRISGPTLQPDGTTTYLLEMRRPGLPL
ncbi:MAG: GNAT family N-acetyltransferase [Bacillota bacterium]